MAYKSKQSEYKKSLIFACFSFFSFHVFYFIINWNYPKNLWPFGSFSQQYVIVAYVVRVPMPLFSLLYFFSLRYIPFFMFRFDKPKEMNKNNFFVYVRMFIALGGNDREIFCPKYTCADNFAYIEFVDIIIFYI